MQKNASPSKSYNVSLSHWTQTKQLHKTFSPRAAVGVALVNGFVDFSLYKGRARLMYLLGGQPTR
jgi:hypothetical protein